MKKNPDLSAKYDQLRAAGKPHKVAPTAFVGKTAPCAVFWSSSLRKLVQLANMLGSEDGTWQPQMD
jgi:hypothetical protein